jgi:hypothetical protein
MAAEKKTSGTRGSAAKRGASKSSARKGATKTTGTGESASSTKASGSRKTSAGSSRTRSAPRAEAPRRPTAASVAENAARQLRELAGKEVEGVIGLERTDEGWKVQLDVLELRRVPNTTDVLASYEVLVDSDGELEGYRRVHRYVRGTADEGGA